MVKYLSFICFSADARKESHHKILLRKLAEDVRKLNQNICECITESVHSDSLDRSFHSKKSGLRSLRQGANPSEPRGHVGTWSKNMEKEREKERKTVRLVRPRDHSKK